MLTRKRKTRLTHPSLLLLQRALTAAEGAVPARPLQVDVNEQRALQLIARMQAQYKKVQPFVGLGDVSGVGLNMPVSVISNPQAG
jgi:hypothetical protein